MKYPKGQPGQVISLDITDLNHTGDGVGRFQDWVVFVPDSVPGDRLQVKLTHFKSNYTQGQILQILEPSPQRVRPACIVADKCGGCQWQHLAPALQRQTKQEHLHSALKHIGKFENPELQPLLSNQVDLGYRNKATYPLARSQAGQVQAGYYRRQSHRLINLNQCPVQDSRLDPLLKEIKADIQLQGWSIYDESQKRGKLRHLSLRLGRRTGEILLTLVSTQASLANLQAQAEIWLGRYPQLVGVTLNLQPQANNLIFGPETQVLAGKGSCREIFAGLEFELAADTFFQINTEVAELLLEKILAQLNCGDVKTVLDAYCGIGTFTLPLARYLAHLNPQIIGIESHPRAVQQAQHNARLNGIEHITFLEGTVETLLPQLTTPPDLVWLDPPRKGVSPQVLNQLLAWCPETIAYISCQPATLARDLQILCAQGTYRPLWIQGADFFPQTRHLECAVILKAQSRND
jgi:23S rRNA (uracil1939-C5)-methyltransferase